MFFYNTNAIKWLFDNMKGAVRSDEPSDNYHYYNTNCSAPVKADWESERLAVEHSGAFSS